MRLDKYLKVSRLIKRRTVANEACDAEKVSVNGKPARASYDVKEGDIIEINIGAKPLKVRVLDVKEFTKKRTQPLSTRSSEPVILRLLPEYTCTNQAGGALCRIRRSRITLLWKTAGSSAFPA